MNIILKKIFYFITIAIILIFGRYIIEGPGKQMVFVIIVNFWLSVCALLIYSMSSYIFKNLVLKTLFSVILFFILNFYFLGPFFYIELIIYVLSVITLSLYIEDKFR
ncbi:hypothetical protein KK2020170_19310 [Flavobacterium okayamense]|uniref:Uncharacterized protein n=1 Tax=Flavobacterium okayamense TaxID=2830782 RepID=A0ABM7S8R1_9FLAO|nr:hypothetical protein KK2020170_19310 [Flavobacterium okayamense]